MNHEKCALGAVLCALLLCLWGGSALAQQPSSAPSSASAKAPASASASAPAGASGGGEVDSREDRSPGGLYKTFCSNCHDSGLAKAPRTGDKVAWEALLEKRGLDTLVSNTYKGIGLMPTRGACAECSEDEIRAVVLFMLKKAKVDEAKVK
jgi:cytochrome c5